MPARIPLDVDLEDRLLYGLTPLRFAYLALAGVAALAIWSAHGAHLAVRIPVAMLCLGIGAALAWARWHDRSLDAWLVDLAVFLVRNHRVEIDPSALRRRLSRPQRAIPGRPPDSVRTTRPVTVAVSAVQPSAGIRSVGIELAVTLAGQGNRVAIVDQCGSPRLLSRLGMTAPGIHDASGLTALGAGERSSIAGLEWTIRLIPPGDPLGRPDLAVLVADREHPPETNACSRLRVVVNRSEAGDGCLPYDPQLPDAQAAGLPLAIRHPEAPFSRAIGRLAASIQEQVAR